MNLPQISIKRKVAMTCFLLLLIFFGARSYFKIRFDNLPSMDIPYVVISTIYPGASPEEIETDIAKKQEDAVSSIEGIQHISSQCSENICVVSIAFVVGTNTELKIHEVREKLNEISDKMPKNALLPALSKVSANAAPVVTMFLTGKQSIDELYDYVKDKLKPEFSTIQGVGNVDIHGGKDIELHIEIDRKKLAATGITLPEVIAKIQDANVKLPAGQIEEGNSESAVSFNAEFKSFKDLKELDLSDSPEYHIFLGDIAEIKLESEKMRQIGLYNETRAVQFQIVKMNGADSLKLINEAKKKYEEILANGLPSGMQLHWFKDDSEIINGSIEDSWDTIIMGILLTSALLLLFMHNPRSTFILVVTMPVTLAIGIGGMYLCGYNFDTITLLSFASATGVLVSNSIVVVENILKRITNGEKSTKASIDGSNEVLVAVVSSALTNVVVFFPVMMMSTVIGMYMAPFAGTMIVITVISLFISFTLTPMLTSMLCKDAEIKNPFLKWFSVKWNAGFDAFVKFSSKSFLWTRNHPGSAIVLIIAVCALLTTVIMPNVVMDFLPNNDNNTLRLTLKMPSDTSLETTTNACLDIIKVLKQHKEVAGVGTTVGYVNASSGDIGEGVNLAEMTIKLINKAERPDMTHKKFAEILRKEMAQFGNRNIVVSTPSATGSGQALTVYFSGNDSEVLRKATQNAAQILEKSGKAIDVNTNIFASKPRYTVIPDRAVLNNLQVSPQAVACCVAGYVDGVRIGNYNHNGRTFDMRLKVNELKSIRELYDSVVGSIDGMPVNIDTIATMISDPVSLVISRDTRQQSAYVYMNYAEGYAQSDVMDVINKEIIPNLPQGVTFHRDSFDDLLNASMAELVEVFITAILLLFLLMAAVMESWTKPFLIMFTIPLGFIGMFGGCVVLGIPLTMVTLLGGIMMLGIIVNNAILIVDDTSTMVNNGVLPHDAMYQAVLNQLRPIIMTTVASIVGMIPMVTGTGMGSELRQSCGAGVLGGQILPAILVVYLIPAFYYKFVKNEKKVVEEE